MTVRKALDNYRKERLRLVGGPYPHIACSCGFCDVVRAADLLYQRVMAETTPRRWQPPIVHRD